MTGSTTVEGKEADKMEKLILEELTLKVDADKAFQNAVANSWR